MEVLVTGGGGFVGRHLVTALQARGDAVRVLALPDEDTRWLRERGVAVHHGDVRSPGTLVAPMRGADGVVHLAAMMDVWRPEADYRAVNVAGTEHVCRAALEAGVQRLVHMSSSSVYAMGQGRLVDERSPLAPFRDPYPVTKAEGDALVQRMARRERLPAVIVRPDQIFGPGDHLHFAAMAARVRAGRSIVVGSGRNAVPFVFVDDVVQGLLLALDHEAATGGAFNLTSDRPLTQAGLLEAIAGELHVSPPRLHVPYSALYAAGAAAERIASATRSARRPPVTRLGVAFFGLDNRFAIDRARDELGYAPRVPVREGVRRAAAWLREGAPPAPAGDRPAARGVPA